MEQRNSAKALRFLNEALVAGDIVPVNPNAGRKFMEYLPYWVGSATESHVHNVAIRAS
ncbi:MAG: hypothetical protein OXI44_03805 [Bacteroidota bacterium]|nr:hypothetical protein [Bacteroidota bacterium]